VAILLGDKMKGLTPERPQAVEARAAQLIGEAMSIQELRRAAEADAGADGEGSGCFLK
jgi:hypothetical protein